MSQSANAPYNRVDPEMLRERVMRLERCLGFFASVIKSGEPWTDACQREYDAARALTPPTLQTERA